ncbi:glycoside hydrolase family 13 protein [Aulographum hederae CBS 113979]|uniref:Glycoside hydrolase family 13 protein n=1 Tax=Aulographum hederae CBS 113979 TaxID=1176131 RepID=A0A6G1H7H2_9PEZI|nr:glycoside hydrolase family 13 protein [Aulographum hederae CBS 113979]
MNGLESVIRRLKSFTTTTQPPEPTGPVPLNETIFQTFEWDLPADQKHWTRLRLALPSLASVGFTSIWIPPACKAARPEGNGYDIYDHWDIGEFHQKGTRSTKWGNKEELVRLSEEAKGLGIGIVFDAVFNHRTGADGTLPVRAVEVNPQNRRMIVSKPKVIDAWVDFSFSGRNNTYSSLKLDASHFNACDYDHAERKNAIYKFIDHGKDWAQDVDRSENGNYDFLMLNNCDYSNQELVSDAKAWGLWISEVLDLANPAAKGGFRIDAVQHISRGFTKAWIQHLRDNLPGGNNLFFVAEFWNGNIKLLDSFLDKMDLPFLKLYDAPLLNNLASISYGRTTDLRTVFKGTLVEARPSTAVLVISSHDTQRGASMETNLHYKFAPLAYALILLRAAGHPCVFFGDLYGICPPYPSPPTCWGKLPDLVLARRLYAYGNQRDYFEKKNCIGWVREGLKGAGEGESGECGMGVVMCYEFGPEENKPRKGSKDSSKSDASSNGKTSKKMSPLTTATTTPAPAPMPQIRMNVGAQHAGEIWTDILTWEATSVEIGHNGWAIFPCQRNSMAVFVNRSAPGRDLFPVHYDQDFRKDEELLRMTV